MTVNVHDEDKAIEELVVFLRNQDILTLETRGVETFTDIFSGTWITTEFSFTHTNAKNVRSVEVSGVPQVFGTDYIVDYEDAKIIFSTAPTLSASISVVYDYGTDKIFDGDARTDLTLASYPRIAVVTTSIATEDGATDGNINYTRYLFSFYAYADTKSAVREYIKQIRKAILNNKKYFFYLRYITPTSGTGIIKEPNRNDKIVTKVLECTAPLNEEVIS